MKMFPNTLFAPSDRKEYSLMFKMRQRRVRVTSSMPIWMVTHTLEYILMVIFVTAIEAKVKRAIMKAIRGECSAMKQISTANMTL